MDEENNKIEGGIWMLPIIIQLGLVELKVAYVYLWMALGWQKILGIVIFVIYTLFVIAAFAFTIEIISLICKWLNSDNSLLLFILGIFVPSIAIWFVSHMIDGGLPSLFDPRFL